MVFCILIKFFMFFFTLNGTFLAFHVVNPFTPKGFPIDEENRLALDRVKSISVIWHSWEV